MKYLYYYLLLIFLISCGYPDVDDVPNFKDIDLSVQEINDYCESLHSIEENIDKCVNDYKNKK